MLLCKGAVGQLLFFAVYCARQERKRLLPTQTGIHVWLFVV